MKLPRMTMLENTPAHLLGDARYADDKAVRDAAWAKWHERTRVAMPAELLQLEQEGYFEKCRTGDTRAAALFSRLAAYRLNPSGSMSSYGALRKGGGHNVDGYSVDAIVANANPADLMNVYDLVVGVEAPGASLSFNGPLPRRSADTWEAPRPLTANELGYLKPGGGTLPPPPPPCPDPSAHIPKPPLVIPDRGEMMDEAGRLHAFYRAPEGLQRPKGLSINDAPDWEGVGAWLFDVYFSQRLKGKSRDEARAAYVHAIQQTPEWKEKHP